MANFLGQRTRVEFNAHDVSHLTGVSIGSMGKVFDTFQTLADPYDHDIEIMEEASGSFDFIASDVTGGDNKFKEAFALTTGYWDLQDDDASTLASGDADDGVFHVDLDFDATNEITYTIPRYTSVFRRISEAGTSKAAMDGANDTMWVKFRAQGERFDAVAFVVKCSTTDNHTFTVDIVTDSSGVPTDSAVSGMTQSASQSVAHATFNAAKKWFVVTPHSTWSDDDRLTIGTDYWLRVTRTDGNGGDLEFYFADTRQDYAGLYIDANAAIADATLNTANEAVHYIKFKQTEGLKVEVFDFIAAAETSGVKYTFNNVILDSVTPSFANKQATRASVSWKCNDWSLSGI